MKLRHRRLFTEAEVARARLGLDALTARGDVDHGEIVLFESAVGFRTIGARLIAKALDHAVDVGVVDFDLRFVDLDTAVFAQLDLRLHFEFRFVFDRRTFDERIDVLQLRIADRLHTFVRDRVAEAARQQTAHHFVLDLFCEARPDDAHRNFAGTEAGQCRLTAELRRDKLRFVGTQIGGDLPLYGIFDGGKILVSYPDRKTRRRLNAQS